MTAPTIVEYARYHQLTATPLKPEELITSLNALPIDGSQLKEWAAPVCDAAISSEKLQLSREGMQYLSQLSAPVQDVPWDQILDDPHRREKLRMEMPILIGDHEKDLRWFKKQMSLPKLLNDFRLDYNLDRPLSTECMELLDGSRKAADDCWKQCTQMRLDTSTAVLKVLSRSVSDDWTDDVLDGIYQTGLGKPTPNNDVLSPLLAPTVLDTEISDLTAPPDIALEPRSDADVDLDNLALQIERQMQQQDLIQTSDDSHGNASQVRHLLHEASIPPALDASEDAAYFKNPKANLQPSLQMPITLSDLRMEVPLMSDATSKTQLDVCSDFRLDDWIDMDWEQEDVPGPDDEDKQRKLLDSLQEHGNRVRDLFAKDKPAVCEEMLRVQVPGLRQQEKGAPMSRSEILQLVSEHVRPWECRPDKELKLNWVPIPRSFRIPILDEELEGSGDPDRYLGVPGKLVKSEDLLWKQPGLRLLDCTDDSDDEIEADEEFLASLKSIPLNTAGSKRPTNDADEMQQTALGADVVAQESSVPTDLASALAGELRKSDQSGLQPEAIDPSQRLSRKELCDTDLGRPHKRRILSSKLRPHSGTAVEKVVKKVIPSFSTAASLASFLDLRGGKFKRHAMSGDSTCPRHASNGGEDSSDPIQSSQAPMVGLPAVRGQHGRDEAGQADATNLGTPLTAFYSAQKTAKAEGNVEVPSSQQERLPIVPEHQTLPGHHMIFLDEDLIHNQNLMAQIEQAGDEGLRPVYRKLSGLPDIILNPTTCLILTHVQALTQRNLPGQKTSPDTLHDRVRKLSNQFEHVHVLISATAKGFDDHAKVVAEFMCFCTAISIKQPPTKVLPIWVEIGDTHVTKTKRGSIDPLTAWTWHLIAQHSLKLRPEMSFIDDTTLWEIFLRDAGVNAMAAQVMLGIMKRADANDLWGLRKLVIMTAQERQEMFGEIVGKKCLEQLKIALSTTAAA